MPKNQLRKLGRAGKRALADARRPIDIMVGRAKMHLPIAYDFKGAYPTVEAALAGPYGRGMAGYNHDDVVDVSFDKMCNVEVWDYPVILWLERLMPHATALIDAGGHMGTKYRAFSRLLNLEAGPDWIVYDLPAIVRAGRRRAAEDGLKISFVDSIPQLPPAEILLASGLLQYYPHDASHLIQQLATRPRHLILNKVATRDGPAVVTMSKIGPSWVPYQIRDRAAFQADVEGLGYRMVDQWDVPSLSHVIPTHPELGPSQSRGYVFEAV